MVGAGSVGATVHRQTNDRGWQLAAFSMLADVVRHGHVGVSKYLRP